MQAKCPKCDGTAFRMLPDSPHATEVECLNCGHIAPFVSTVTAAASRTVSEYPQKAASRSNRGARRRYPPPTAGG